MSLSPPVTPKRPFLKENTPPTTPPKPGKSPLQEPPRLRRRLDLTLEQSVHDVASPLFTVNSLPVRSLQRFKEPINEIKLSAEISALVDEVQKFPNAQVHIATIQAIAKLIVTKKVSSVWYKQFAVLPDQSLLPESFTIVAGGDRATAYVSRHQLLGKGSISKATSAFRLVFEQGRCKLVEEVVKHMSLVSDDTKERILARIKASTKFKGLKGVAEFYDMVQYTNDLGKHKFVIYFKKYPEAMDCLFNRWFDPRLHTMEQRIFHFDKLARRLGSVLAVIHKENYIHRDVKPSNILIKANDIVLSDFDLSASIGVESLAGTMENVAPEIAWKCFNIEEYPKILAAFPDAQKITEATDMYSLGVALHDAYYGTLPPLSLLILSYLNINNLIEEQIVAGLPVNPLDFELKEAKLLKCKAQFELQLAVQKEAYLERGAKVSPPPRTPEELINRLLCMNPAERPTAAEVARYASLCKSPLFS